MDTKKQKQTICSVRPGAFEGIHILSSSNNSVSRRFLKELVDSALMTYSGKPFQRSTIQLEKVLTDIQSAPFFKQFHTISSGY